jgi:hypothetical protein
VRKTEWFVIKGGEHEGRAHLSGWLGSGLYVKDWRTGGNQWWCYSTCPRCFAIVEDKAVLGDVTWAHEQWHAETDFPIPPEVLAQVTRP